MVVDVGDVWIINIPWEFSLLNAKKGGRVFNGEWKLRLGNYGIVRLTMCLTELAQHLTKMAGKPLFMRGLDGGVFGKHLTRHLTRDLTIGGL